MAVQKHVLKQKEKVQETEPAPKQVSVFTYSGGPDGNVERDSEGNEFQITEEHLLQQGRESRMTFDLDGKRVQIVVNKEGEFSIYADASLPFRLDVR